MKVDSIETGKGLHRQILSCSKETFFMLCKFVDYDLIFDEKFCILQVGTLNRKNVNTVMHLMYHDNFHDNTMRKVE
jgi:hypothetical protein